MERAQTGREIHRGLGLRKVERERAERLWESRPQRVKVPYAKFSITGRIQSTARHVEPCGKTGGPPPKAKYYLVTDSA